MAKVVGVEASTPAAFAYRLTADHRVCDEIRRFFPASSRILHNAVVPYEQRRE